MHQIEQKVGDLLRDASTLTLAEAISAHAAQVPEQAAILAPNRRSLTYKQLDMQIQSVARQLNSTGVGRNDRVAIVLPNGPELAVTVLAVSAVATSAPLNPSYRAGEFDFFLSDIETKALIVLEGMDSPARAVAAAHDIPVIELSPDLKSEAGLFTLSSASTPTAGYAELSRPDDVALVLYTSGTTSRAKLVSLTHANLWISALNIQMTLALSRHDRCLNVMPLFHVHGLVGALFSSLSAGASVVCTPGLDAAQFFHCLEVFHPTWYTAVPTMHQAILAQAQRNAEVIHRYPLRFIRSCSAPLPSRVITELEDTFKVPVIESYGMTEAAHQIASNPLPPNERKNGSVGLPTGTEIAVIDDERHLLAPGEVGEIVIRGETVIGSYADDGTGKQESFTNGWFRTGDQGYLDSDGYLYLTGRLKDIINRGGEKISPYEVESALSDHAAIAEAVVFPLVHRTLGEDIAAAVVLKDDAAVTEIELQQFVLGKVAEFKIPRRIEIVGQIPKGPTGKLQRSRLAEQLGLGVIGFGKSETRAEYVEPRTELEVELVRIWEEVLRIERIGVHDNFFDLGGHSLLATQVMSRIGQAFKVELPLRALFERPKAAELAKCIEEACGEDQRLSTRPMVPVSRDQDLPLSFSQQRLWFLNHYEPNSSVYNIPSALRLRGSLNIGALEQSLNEIIRRHESLRTTFSMVDGEPVQVIAPSVGFSLAVVDLRSHPEGEREEEARQLAREEAGRPFDLARGPLFRSKLLRLSEDDHVLLLTMHHIVSDGWSMGVLYRELSALYEAFCVGKPSPLSGLSIQYADFAVWQREWLQGEVLESQLSYWKKQLEGIPAVLNLPTDHPRPAVQSYRGASQSIQLSRELTQSLKALSRKEGVTLFMTLLAAFQTLLYRYTGQEDIAVGSPIANRNRAEIEGLIGFFVNTLVMRSNFSDNPTFKELLARVREMALDAYGHQDLPFEKLVEELKPERSLSHSPLFQVAFAYQNTPNHALRIPGVLVTPVEKSVETTKFDLHLSVSDADEGITAILHYATDLYDDVTAARILGHFRVSLDGIVADPDRRVSELPILTEAEEHQLLVEWNDTKRDYPKDNCIHQSFEEQVEKSPEAVAVVFENEQLTYRELNARANRLAHYLRKQGVGPESLVGICTDRSLEMVVGLLAILKAGAAYVPLDPEYPKERLAFMLEDTHAPVLLTQERLVERLPNLNGHLVCLDRDWPRIAEEPQENAKNKVSAYNIAYIIYTSGTTGKPKGVMISHHNVSRLFRATEPWFHFSKDDVWTVFHSYAFDFSVWELWGALLYGGRAVIVPYWMSRSPEQFYELLCREQVTVLNQTPSAFRQLIRADQSVINQTKLTLRSIILGGEALDFQSLQPWFDRHGDECPQLVNMYGITETTVHVTFRVVKGIDINPVIGSLIGGPIPDLELYVLDKHRRLVPIGVPGELYVGGAGVARGYLNRPDLSAERFVLNPFSGSKTGKLYKTGDLVRRLSNSDIEYLGRTDDQVKVRGFRIELGEIESVLSQHPAVRETVVLAREEVEVPKTETQNRKSPDPSAPLTAVKQLVAYVVPTQQRACTINKLRSFVKKKLPEYMVPSAFVFLDRLPLTPNGKVDRKALPVPDQRWPELEEVYVAPRTPVEEMIAEIWGEVLKLPKVGVHDNFFELGGHSLLATQLVSRLRERLLVELPLRALFENATVASLTEYIETIQSIKRQHQGTVTGVSEETEEIRM